MSETRPIYEHEFAASLAESNEKHPAVFRRGWNQALEEYWSNLVALWRENSDLTEGQRNALIQQSYALKNKMRRG